MCCPLCPQPLVDVLGHCAVNSNYRDHGLTHRANQHAALALSTLARIALAAVGAIALAGSHFGIACAIGAIVSLPATMIAAGSLGVYYGIAAIVASASTGSFATLGVGLLTFGVGYSAMQNYMALPIGLSEQCLAQPA